MACAGDRSVASTGGEGTFRQDRAPRWRHAAMDGAGAMEVAAMLLPLGADTLKL